MARVVVVGGGVMGSAAAWHLALRGADVTLLEQFGRGHTEGSSHGSSRIYRLGYPDPLYVDLALRALPWWRRLEDQTGESVLTLTGAVDHGPPKVIQELAATVRHAGQTVETMTTDEAESRWPAMRFAEAVMYHPTAGRVHADHAVRAFQRAATARGADVRHETTVQSVVRRGPDRVEIVTDDEVLVADAVVLAAGGWAPSVAGPLVALPPLRVTQEQPAHFPTVDGSDPLSWPSFIHHQVPEVPGLPGVPTVYGLGSVDGVKVGFHGVGDEVDPSHRDRTVDQVAQRRVQDYAARWLPGVDSSAPTAVTCLYTLTSTEDFVIDRVGPVTVLAGFSGHGFKFASVIGELAADLVDGRPGPPRFALAR